MSQEADFAMTEANPKIAIWKCQQRGDGSRGKRWARERLVMFEVESVKSVKPAVRTHPQKPVRRLSDGPNVSRSAFLFPPGRVHVTLRESQPARLPESRPAPELDENADQKCRDDLHRNHAFNRRHKDFASDRKQTTTKRAGFIFVAPSEPLAPNYPSLLSRTTPKPLGGNLPVLGGGLRKQM